MQSNPLNIKTLVWKILLPVGIGLAVVAYMFCREFSPTALRNIDFGVHTILGIALACLFVVGRDFGLTWRFHTIAAPDVNWRQALRIDLMCAFASAITPSAVGGSAFAIFFLNREGVSVGRATTLTLTTLFLDELFFVIFCPIILLMLPLNELFGEALDQTFIDGVQIVFWTVYAGIVIWTAILFFGIIVKPQGVKKLLIKCFRVKILRRWLPSIEEMTDNLVNTSVWIRRCPLSWWLKVFGATIVSWFSRYLIVNAIFWAFVPTTSTLLIFGRQFVVWVLLMVSPTPGSSGVSEWIFTEYYGDLIGSGELAVIMALIWRLITYYLYLVIGVCLIPSYFKKKKSLTNDSL